MERSHTYLRNFTTINLYSFQCRHSCAKVRGCCFQNKHILYQNKWLFWNADFVRHPTIHVGYNKNQNSTQCMIPVLPANQACWLTFSKWGLRHGMVCLCKSICIYFQGTVNHYVFANFLAISHFCKQCLFCQQLKILDYDSSNNSICLVSLLPYKVNIAKIYRLMFL